MERPQVKALVVSRRPRFVRPGQLMGCSGLVPSESSSGDAVRYRRLLERSKRHQKVVVAVARELVGFMWASDREVSRSLPPA